MKVNAVICEYNPFHNGHKFLIDSIKNEPGNAIIAIMSGSFTQRGDVAVADKFLRASAAVKNGADLVIELPTVYSCASAQYFAEGGVKIAEAAGIVDRLCFGAENNDINALKIACEAFESESFKSELKKNMDSGDCYPGAVSKTVSALYSPALAEIVEQPNNILAIEYLRALKNSAIEPFAVKRSGAPHDSEKPKGSIASAFAIRAMIADSADYSEYIPRYIIGNPSNIKNIGRVILYKLRSMSAEEIKNLPDVREGLENRIYDAAKTAASFEELIHSVKTKRYTMARIRRILICALLNITAEMPKSKAEYIRVLAFNDTGARLLGEIKERSPVPLITNVADGFGKLGGRAKRMFDVDIRATDIQALASGRVEPRGRDFTKGIIKVDS